MTLGTEHSDRTLKTYRLAVVVVADAGGADVVVRPGEVAGHPLSRGVFGPVVLQNISMELWTE